MKSKIKMAVACGGGIFTTTVVTDTFKRNQKNYGRVTTKTIKERK